MKFRGGWPLVAFAILLLHFGYFAQGGGFNQNSTVGEIRNRVEKGVDFIDDWTSVTGDVSHYGGHVYSNKSPSVLFFAAPMYRVVYGIAQALGVDTGGTAYQLFATHVIGLLCGGVWGAGLGPLTFWILGLLFPAFSRRRRGVLAIAIPLASLVAPYATMAFLHAFETFWATALYGLWLSWWRGPTTAKAAGLGLAGACLGLGNPTLFPLAGLVGLAVLVRSVRERRGAEVALFTAVFFAFLAPWFGYNASNFGGWLKTNRDFQAAEWRDPHLFLGVFAAPSFDRLGRLFFWGNRAIFPLFAYLLFAGPDLRRRPRLEVAPLYVLLTLQILFLLTFNGWHGGSAFGPRYACPILFLVALHAAAGVVSRPWLYKLSLAIPALVLLGVTAVEPMPGFEIRSPLTGHSDQAILKRFLKGDFPDTGYPSFPTPGAPRYRYNLGQAVAPKGGWLSLLPLLLTECLALWAAWALLREKPARPDERSRSARPSLT